MFLGTFAAVPDEVIMDGDCDRAPGPSDAGLMRGEPNEDAAHVPSSAVSQVVHCPPQLQPTSMLPNMMQPNENAALMQQQLSLLEEEKQPSSKQLSLPYKIQRLDQGEAVPERHSPDIHGIGVGSDSGKDVGNQRVQSLPTGESDVAIYGNAGDQSLIGTTVTIGAGPAQNDGQHLEHSHLAHGQPTMSLHDQQQLSINLSDHHPQMNLSGLPDHQLMAAQRALSSGGAPLENWLDGSAGMRNFPLSAAGRGAGMAQQHNPLWAGNQVAAGGALPNLAAGGLGSSNQGMLPIQSHNHGVATTGNLPNGNLEALGMQLPNLAFPFQHNAQPQLPANALPFDAHVGMQPPLMAAPAQLDEFGMAAAPLEGINLAISEQQQKEVMGAMSDLEDDTEETNEKSPKKVRKRRTKTFPEKLLEALTKHGSDDSVAWLPDGKSFVVVNDELFVQQVMSKDFKASKYSSFVRKLHRWGFVRLTSGTGTDCFHHPLFQKGRPDLASTITSAPRGKDVGKKGKQPSISGVEQFLKQKASAEAAVALSQCSSEIPEPDPLPEGEAPPAAAAAAAAAEAEDMPITDDVWDSDG